MHMVWPFTHRKETPAQTEAALQEEHKQLAARIVPMIKDFFDNHENSKKNRNYYKMNIIEKNGENYSIIINYLNGADQSYYPICQININCRNKDKELHFHKAYHSDVYFSKTRTMEFIGYVKQEMRNG